MARTRQAVADADLLGSLQRRRVQRAVPREPRQGPDRPLDRLRPADPDRLRPRRSGSRAARSAGSACPSRTSATCDQLFDGLPLDEMNTSMTINATARVALGALPRARRGRGRRPRRLQGTTQNDLVKEFLSRGTYIFAPEPSKRLIVDMIAYGHDHVAKWNPINVCSYHLQEAGATPVQEIAYALATAIDVLDAVRDVGQGRRRRSCPDVVARICFFVNAGIRFVEETAKMRAFTAMWDEICRDRYGVAGPLPAPLPLRRAGELARAHRTAAREQRAAHRARDARRDARPPTRGRAPSSCPRGTRRSGSRARPTSSGSCASSRSSPSRPTCSSTPTSSRARSVMEAKTDELTERRPGRARRRARPRRRVRGDRRAEEPTRREPVRAGRAHRVGRAGRRRRQLLHRDRARRRSRATARSRRS